MKCVLSLLLIALGFLTNVCHGLMCEEEDMWGQTKYRQCPGTFDSEELKFCCGSKESRLCCSNPLGLNDEDFKEIAEHLTMTTEIPITSKTLVTQEGIRDEVNKLKVKVKDKINGTVSGTKDKIKQKIKDKAKKKIEEKLDPTGGRLNLPTILGILFAVAITLIILCVVCCCCCPFCLLHKRRSRGVVHNPVPPQAANMQPMMAGPPQQQNYAPVQSGPPYSQPQYPPPQGYAPPPQPGYGPHPGAPYPTAASPYPPPTGGDNPPPYAEKQMAFNPNY